VCRSIYIRTKSKVCFFSEGKPIHDSRPGHMIDRNLFGDIRDPVALAIERLKIFEPPEGYWLAFSGGKDSVCIKRLAEMAGVKFEAHYNVTTIDPPELVRFIRDVHPDVKMDRGKLSYFQTIPIEGFPTRQHRWCCRRLKEAGGKGRVVVTGVRAAESANRSGRGVTGSCFRNRKRFVLPIVDWTEAEVWAFIRTEKIPYCCLYDQGFTRLGCIACPMAGTPARKMHLERWPKFRPAFLLAFSKLIADRQAKGKWNTRQWPDAEHLLAWWLSNQPAATKDQQWFDYE
jgi:phosphoadenosine phosphosulfate reductase